MRITRTYDQRFLGDKRVTFQKKKRNSKTKVSKELKDYYYY